VGTDKGFRIYNCEPFKETFKRDFSSGGIASSTHFVAELFNSMAGIQATHVPFKGIPEALNAVIAGTVNYTITPMPNAIPQAASGKVNALGLTVAKRQPQMADTPTIAEAGVKGYESSVWYALLGPRGMPPEIVKRLNTEIGSLIKAELGTQFEADGITPSGAGPEQLAAFVRSESQKWGKVVKQSGAKLD
jgi:tripartite-type tricarboxylate transporter receptor subunit TctC